jgi:hypothetical protein
MPWLQRAPAAEVKQLAQALLAGNTRWHVTLHDTLSWLADDDWPALVAAALQSAQARGSMSEAERTVLEAASYQQPELIKPLIAPLQNWTAMSSGLRLKRRCRVRKQLCI